MQIIFKHKQLFQIFQVDIQSNIEYTFSVENFELSILFLNNWGYISPTFAELTGSSVRVIIIYTNVHSCVKHYILFFYNRITVNICWKKSTTTPLRYKANNSRHFCNVFPNANNVATDLKLIGGVNIKLYFTLNKCKNIMLYKINNPLINKVEPYFKAKSISVRKRLVCESIGVCVCLYAFKASSSLKSEWVTLRTYLKCMCV